MNIDKWRVGVENLRWICNPEQFKFKSTEALTPLVGVVGQDRAIDSIDFGFKIKTRGFNIYAAGPTGTGKHSAITSYVKELASTEPVPHDWCFVFNFNEPDRPLAIELESGAGISFSKDMDELIEVCKMEIPKAFESEEYERRKDSLLNQYQAKRDASLAHLREHAAARDFSVELTTAGIITVPITDGRLMKRDEYDQLPEGEKERIRAQTEELQTETNRAMTIVRAQEKEAKQKLLELDKEIAIFAIGHLLDELRSKYAVYDRVTQYLQDVQDNIADNLEAFKETDHQPQMQMPGMPVVEQESPWSKYKVNTFINQKDHGAPVVFEPNPTYYNLFGRLEYTARLGTMSTDFTMIKPGAIHRANGGYLILNALDVLLNFISYDALKRVLKTHESRIENIGEQFRVVPAVTLQPEPVPIDVKVILIGDRRIYNLLFNLDEDFKKLFKVKADFQVDMNRSVNHTDKYAALIGATCRRENLKHFDRNGVARIIEYGAWMAEDKDKLSTRFIDINDLICEASYWASTNGNTYVGRNDVQRAIKERVYRSNMIEEKIRELIADGTIMIDTEGEVVGQANGLEIIFLGDYIFGKPARITSRAYVGKKGVISIERESKMSGQIYNKAMLILAGYLAGNFADDKPLTMSATIAFEQSYTMVEGDSASSAELYTLFSSLSGVPIKQGIAITGSINQQGEIQPIGAVNRKIEGYFDVCKVKGLDKNQGVLIPRLNVKNLMLRDDVIEAVKAGEWNIWAIDHVNEGLEILTGRPAGKRRSNGDWEPDTINYLVDQRLRRLGDDLRRFESNEASEDREAA